MEVSILLLALIAVFGFVQFFLSRKEKLLESERRSITEEDFRSSSELRGISSLVAEAVFLELEETLGFPPLAEDKLYEDYGLAGGDMDDLVSRVSKRLRIPLEELRRAGGRIHTVADLAKFIESSYEAEPGKGRELEQ